MPPLLRALVCVGLIGALAAAAAGDERKPADRDHDGMADEVDRCPDVTGAGGQTADGCPRRAVDALDTGPVELRERVRFSRGSAALSRRERQVLDAVAKTLDFNKDVRRVRIVGHRAPKEHRALPAARAAAVLRYLVSRGVSGRRLVAVAGQSGPPPAGTASVVFEVSERGERDAPPP